MASGTRSGRVKLLVSLALALVATRGDSAPARNRHRLEVALDPEAQSLRVRDTVTLAGESEARTIEFLLNAALSITHAEPAVREIPLGSVAAFFSINGMAPELGQKTRLKRYRVDLPAGGTGLLLDYHGRFDFPLDDAREEYTRGFRETVGQVGKSGVYLAGGSFWYPHLGQELLEFELEAGLPPGWQLVSQGKGTARDREGKARWDSEGAMDEIYLVGGPLESYRAAAGPIETLVLLRQKDDALAQKYLEATAQYLEMYRGLIGSYPYSKFALVENYWETGYGMPSFTLLGEKVLRFPFILSSSYPHEILHNWWGNSVFVDYASGNWCEGLTAYLADHLIQEQRGKGAEYRRATLQKYRDYVRTERDIPLAEFRSRSSAATEAVGYGKALMLFHMLRLHLGDERFRDWLTRLYREGRGQRAGFADLRRLGEQVAGHDLGWLFSDLLRRPGAAALAVELRALAAEGEGFVLTVELRQAQSGEPFTLEVPVALVTAQGTEREVVKLETRSRSFELRSRARPLALHVDPGFDVFRRLDPRETPPSIGQIFGEPRILAVLAASATEAERKRYQDLMAGWNSESHAIELASDSELKALPVDRSIWLLGAGNRFAAERFGEGSGYRLTAGEVAVGGERMPRPGHSLVLVGRHPQNLDRAVGWIAIDDPAAFPGLGRKLPHYGKYSYVGFAGGEPINVLKGQLGASDSPLSVDLRAAAERSQGPLPAPVLATAKALAELPPVFSEPALRDHVSFLAAPEREGRGLGSAGLEAAGRYIEEQMKASGLRGAGGDGGYRQKLTVTKGPDGVAVETANIIGLLPGSRAEWQEQSVVVAAHYDHLGRGWPDVHEGYQGRIHPGADDNASGVAVLLELARVFAHGETPARNILFIAFTAEEAGRAGSRFWVDHPGAFPMAKIIGVINLDSVGRLGAGRVDVLGTATASEWQHIFRGASFVTGVESRNIPEPLDSSDQASFVEKGVPAVQVFTGAHPDYHRPSDVVAAVDGAGLVKVAALVREAVAYLAERPEPLSGAAGAAGRASAATPAAAAGARRVSFGTVPDFAFPGPGVRLEGVVPGSPAERAGLRGGDLLIALDDHPIASLAAYAERLKQYAPGQVVRARLRRDGNEIDVEVTCAAR